MIYSMAVFRQNPDLTRFPLISGRLFSYSHRHHEFEPVLERMGSDTGLDFWSTDELKICIRTDSFWTRVAFMAMEPQNRHSPAFFINLQGLLLLKPDPNVIANQLYRPDLPPHIKQLCKDYLTTDIERGFELLHQKLAVLKLMLNTRVLTPEQTPKDKLPREFRYAQSPSSIIEDGGDGAAIISVTPGKFDDCLCLYLLESIRRAKGEGRFEEDILRYFVEPKMRPFAYLWRIIEPTFAPRHFSAEIDPHRLACYQFALALADDVVMMRNRHPTAESIEVAIKFNPLSIPPHIEPKDSYIRAIGRKGPILYDPRTVALSKTKNTFTPSPDIIRFQVPENRPVWNRGLRGRTLSGADWRLPPVPHASPGEGNLYHPEFISDGLVVILRAQRSN